MIKNFNENCFSPRTLTRGDGKCGPKYPIFPNSSLANPRYYQCDPNSNRPCCSAAGVCSPVKCDCINCVDYRVIESFP